MNFCLSWKTDLEIKADLIPLIGPIGSARCLVGTLVARLVDVDVDRVRLIGDVEFYFLLGHLKAGLRLGANGCVCDHLDGRAVVSRHSNPAIDIVNFQNLPSIAGRKIQRSPYRVALLETKPSLSASHAVDGNETRHEHQQE